MRKIFYDSWVCNLLLKSYVAITVFCFIFTKYLKEEVKGKQYLINHECTHVQQWNEFFIISAVIVFISLLFTKGEGYLWFLSCFGAWYIYYVIEFVGKYIYYAINPNKKHKKDKSIWYNAYKMISFEIDARFSEYDNNYLENRPYFNSLKYIFKV